MTIRHARSAINPRGGLCGAGRIDRETVTVVDDPAEVTCLLCRGVPPLVAATAALYATADALSDARAALNAAQARYDAASARHLALARTEQHDRGLHDYEPLPGCPSCDALAALDPATEEHL